ncbi:hypothetical protein LIER_13947 [Lithospermum erythrorhizon]|uniref:Uncharacterized protein n=1 Tax=Lithospermum erythrorhizon TaxID=34254 RepID=A0AAV3Q2I4_LITER
MTCEVYQFGPEALWVVARIFDFEELDYRSSQTTPNDSPYFLVFDSGMWVLLGEPCPGFPPLLLSELRYVA